MKDKEWEKAEAQIKATAACDELTREAQEQGFYDVCDPLPFYHWLGEGAEKPNRIRISAKRIIIMQGDNVFQLRGPVDVEFSE